jgi:hypothetical protein
MPIDDEAMGEDVRETLQTLDKEKENDGDALGLGIDKGMCESRSEEMLESRRDVYEGLAKSRSGPSWFPWGYLDQPGAGLGHLVLAWGHLGV